MPNYNYGEFETYEDYESLFDPKRTSRQARRKRKPRIRPAPKKSRSEIVEELADDPAGLESGFETTYSPSKYETGWLLDSLRNFYDRALITDVLALVKGGKEASVYCCRAHESTGAALLAAKVYRPRMFRQLRNDKMYREGRDILTPDGRPVGMEAERVAHAIETKSTYGRKAAHTSWLMYEYTTLEKLYKAGAAVPRPYAAAENAILMDYCGDKYTAAPMLSEVTLAPDEAEPLFREAMHSVETMLQHEMVHGDLSAYNLLYWEGTITLIDFPQVVDVYANPNAYTILKRDLTRLCDYFAAQGAVHNPGDLLEALWYQYVGIPVE